DASARGGARVLGARVVERVAAGQPWVSLGADQRMHPGWHLACPDGCTLELPGGERIRLDEGTTVRDLESVFVFDDQGEPAAVPGGLERVEGCATAYVPAGGLPLALQTTDGTQFVIDGGHVGRAGTRSGRGRFDAMDGDARVRAPGGGWETIAAGSAVF